MVRPAWSQPAPDRNREWRATSEAPGARPPARNEDDARSISSQPHAFSATLTPPPPPMDAVSSRRSVVGFRASSRWRRASTGACTQIAAGGDYAHDNQFDEGAAVPAVLDELRAARGGLVLGSLLRSDPRPVSDTTGALVCVVHGQRAGPTGRDTTSAR